MIIYEVNFEFAPEIIAPFQDFMRQHIAEMLKFEGFHSAEYWSVKREKQDLEWCKEVVQYRVQTLESLERYLREDAERMRQPALDLFTNQFRATRRILLPKLFKK